MINSNELRKGNLISVAFLKKDKPTVVIIDRIDNEQAGYVDLNGNQGLMPYQYFNGIPLSTEWLEKFGFVDPAGNGWGYRMSINSVDELCWYLQDGFIRYQTKGDGFTRQLDHIKFVHQLQNLYLDLTGQELTIKEPV